MSNTLPPEFSVYVHSLELTNVRCFTHATFDFTKDGKLPQWTVLLGNNGVGKTTVLRAIAQLINETKEYYIGYVGDPNDTMKIKPVFFDENQEALSFPFRKDKITSLISKSIEKQNNFQLLLSNQFLFNQKLSSNLLIPNFEGDDFQFYNIEIVPQNVQIENSQLFYRKKVHSEGCWLMSTDRMVVLTGKQAFFAYGASRRMGVNPISNIDEINKEENFATLFDPQKPLLNVEEYLLQLLLKNSEIEKDENIRKNARKKIDILKTCLLDKVLPEIIDFDLVTAPKFGVEFQHKAFGKVRLNDMSLGYQTMTAWLVDFAIRMIAIYGEQLDSPLHGPAVCLVDEIDLHLHPSWQRKLFKHLSEVFPNTQFIVTAHSPLIVQAAPEANIILLKEENGQVTATQHNEDIRGYRIDQILESDLYENVSTLDPETDADYKEQLNYERKLAQGGVLTEAEQKKLKELQEKLFYLGFNAVSVDKLYQKFREAFLRRMKNELTDDQSTLSQISDAEIEASLDEILAKTF